MRRRLCRRECPFVPLPFARRRTILRRPSHKALPSSLEADELPRLYAEDRRRRDGGRTSWCTGDGVLGWNNGYPARNHLRRSCRWGQAGGVARLFMSRRASDSHISPPVGATGCFGIAAVASTRRCCGVDGSRSSRERWVIACKLRMVCWKDIMRLNSKLRKSQANTMEAVPACNR